MEGAINWPFFHGGIMNNQKLLLLYFFIGTLVFSLCGCSSNKVKKADNYNHFSREIVESESNPRMVKFGINSTFEHYIMNEIQYEVSDDGTNTIKAFQRNEYEYKTGKREDHVWSNLPLESIVNFVQNGNVVAVINENIIYLYDLEDHLIVEKSISDIQFEAIIGNGNTDATMNMVWGVAGDENYIYIIGYNTQEDEVIYIVDYDFNGQLAYTAGKVTKWNLVLEKGSKIVLYNGQDRYIYTYNENKNQIEKKNIKIEDMFDSYSKVELMNGTSQYDYLYVTRNHVDEDTGRTRDYLIGVKGNSQEIILDLVTMGIQELNVMSVQSDGNDGYWFVCVSEMDDNRPVINYHFIPSEAVQDYSLQAMKATCKIGTLFFPLDIVPQINDFNMHSDTYYLDIIDYSEMYEDYEVANTHLFLDVLNGELDGVFLNSLLEEDLLRNEALLDLSDYVKNTTVLTEESLVDSYLKSVTSEKGEIYGLYPSFYTSGFAYTQKIDFKNMEKYNESISKNERFLFSSSERILLADIIRYSNNEYIDEEKGRVYIKEEPFLSVLRLIKEQKQSISSPDDQYMQLCTGYVKSIQVTIPDPYWYVYLNRLYDNKMEINNVTTDHLIISSRNGLLGISKLAKQKEAIMEFWDFLFEPEYYRQAYTSDCWKLPIFKGEYDVWKKRLLATESFIDEYGNDYRIIDAVYGNDVSEITIEKGSISEEEIDKIIASLKEAEYIPMMKEAYLEIILDDADAYFEGTKTLEETCEIMENRLLTAMEENK